MLGLSSINDVADVVFGNAITSRIFSVLANNITSLSNPNAIPPCGGAPYESASTKNPNLSTASFLLKPSNENTFSCTSIELQKKMQSDLDIKNGDILFMVGDESKIVLNALGHLRNEIAKREDLINTNKHYPIWVTEFPMFEYDNENDRYTAMHHPFTAPRIEDINLLDTNPSQALSRGYDLTMNGYEIAGGSIRNIQQNYRNKYFHYWA